MLSEVAVDLTANYIYPILILLSRHFHLHKIYTTFQKLYTKYVDSQYAIWYNIGELKGKAVST